MNAHREASHHRLSPRARRPARPLLLAIFVFHEGFGWARGGFLGVSSFFTLSGFLITALLLAEHEDTGRIAITAFWRRRIRRLLPASLVVLGGIAAVSVVAVDTGQRLRLPGDVTAAVLNVAELAFRRGGDSYAAIFRSESPVQHLWSLAIEEQFYVLYPVLLAGSADRARLPLAARLTVGLVGTLAVSIGLGNWHLARTQRSIGSTSAPTYDWRSSSSARFRGRLAPATMGRATVGSARLCRGSDRLRCSPCSCAGSPWTKKPGSGTAAG